MLAPLTLFRHFSGGWEGGRDTPRCFACGRREDHHDMYALAGVLLACFTLISLSLATE